MRGKILGLLVVLCDDINRSAPLDFLVVVDFTQIQNLALHDTIIRDAAIFHDAPIAMLFAVFETLL